MFQGNSNRLRSFEKKGGGKSLCPINFFRQNQNPTNDQPQQPPKKLREVHMKSSFLQVGCRLVSQREQTEKNLKNNTVIVEICTFYKYFFRQSRNSTNGLDPRNQNIDQAQLRIMVYVINTSFMTVILKTVRKSSVLAVIQKSLDQQLSFKYKYNDVEVRQR